MKEFTGINVNVHLPLLLKISKSLKIFLELNADEKFDKFSFDMYWLFGK